jgi:hypothetical protein
MLTNSGATMYQHTAVRLAATRMSPEVPREDFADTLGGIARRLRLSVPDLDHDERALLDEYGREEGRYPMKTLQRLIAIARRSRKAEDRHALAEAIRARSLTQGDVRDVPVVFDEETEANGLFNVAQREFERRPSPSTKARCVELGTRQLEATRESIDAVLGTPCP